MLDYFARIFTQPMDKEALRARVNGGHYSLADALLARAMSGDEKLLAELFRRVCDHQRPESTPLTIDDADAIITKAQEDLP